MISLDSLLALANTGHTELQLDRFVTVRSGGTPYGCLFQSLRELIGRWRGLRNGYLLRKKLLLKLEFHQSRASGESFKARMSALKVDELDGELQECERHLRIDEREFLRFYSQASGLYVHLGFDVEPPTSERLAALDAEKWEHRILCDAALSYMTTGGINHGVLSLIQCLPCEQRARVVRRCFGDGDPQSRRRSLDALAAWFLSYSPDIPDPLALSEAESRRLLECASSPLPKLLANSSKMDAISSPETNCGSGSEHARLASGVPA